MILIKSTNGVQNVGDMFGMMKTTQIKCSLFV